LEKEGVIVAKSIASILYYYHVLQEIEDDAIIECSYTPTNDLEKNEISSLECSCLLNLAVVYVRLNQWADW
jgi:hypothetical protein